jgi:polyisoprenoid-binding protein YceI
MAIYGWALSNMDNMHVFKEKKHTKSKHKIDYICFLFALLLSLGFASAAESQDEFVIDPAESSITCSARYVIIGEYEAVFEKFSGTIHFDPQNLEKSDILLDIDIESVQSTHPKLDNFVRSKRLMDAERYPKSIFQSYLIEKEEEGYKVTGMLTLHGVIKEISFPFTVEGPHTDHNETHLIAKGKWLIKRKDFKIVWSKLLDRGGIIVSDYIAVDWEVKAIRK